MTKHARDETRWDDDDGDAHEPRRLNPQQGDGLIPPRQSRRDADLDEVRRLEEAGRITSGEAVDPERAIQTAAGTDISTQHAENRAGLALLWLAEDYASRCAPMPCRVPPPMRWSSALPLRSPRQPVCFWSHAAADD